MKTFSTCSKYSSIVTVHSILSLPPPTVYIQLPNNCTMGKYTISNYFYTKDESLQIYQCFKPIINIIIRGMMKCDKNNTRSFKKRFINDKRQVKFTLLAKVLCNSCFQCCLKYCCSQV